MADRNKTALESFKAKHGGKQPCAWPECDQQEFMSIATAAVIEKDGKLVDFKAGEIQFPIPLCHRHFQYPMSGLVAMKLDAEEKPVGLVAQFDAIRMTEAIARAMCFAHDIDKKKAEDAKAHAEAQAANLS